MIPKIIHYCWLSNDPIPQDLQNYMLSWKEKLPDYEFILWNFDRFDKKTSKWVAQAFDNKKYAFAADYIRLYAVYNYGGFYMDIDIEVLKSFDDLLENQIVLAYENEQQTGIEAGVFGAEKNNHIIKECLDYYTDRNFIREDGSFETLPLPQIMIQFCKNIEIKDRFFFTCKSFKTGIIATRTYSHTIHHFAGSWWDDWQKEVKKYTSNLYAKNGYNVLTKIKAAIFYIYKSFQNLGVIKGCGYWASKIKLKLRKYSK